MYDDEDDATILGYDSHMYVSQLADDGPDMVLKNWDFEDLVAYIGGEYAKMDYRNKMKENANG